MTPCEICDPWNNPLCTMECQEVCPFTKSYKVKAITDGRKEGRDNEDTKHDGDCTRI